MKDNVTRPMKEENGNGEPRVLYGQAKDFRFYSETGNGKNVLRRVTSPCSHRLTLARLKTRPITVQRGKQVSWAGFVTYLW